MGPYSEMLCTGHIRIPGWGPLLKAWGFNVGKIGAQQVTFSIRIYTNHWYRMGIHCGSLHSVAAHVIGAFWPTENTWFLESSVPRPWCQNVGSSCLRGLRDP